MRQVNEAVSAQDEASLLAALRLPALGLLGVQEAHAHWYLEHLSSHRQHKTQVSHRRRGGGYSSAVRAFDNRSRVQISPRALYRIG